MAFTTNLESLDCGVATAKRAWPLPHKSSIVAANASWSGCSEVLVFGLKKSAICRQPTAFDQFDRNHDMTALLEAFFQIVWRALEKTVASLRSKATERLTQNEFPIKVFLECVLENEANRVVDEQTSYDLQQKRKAAEFMADLCSEQICVPDDLLHGAQSEMDTGVFQKSHMDRIKFMRQPDNARPTGPHADTRDYDSVEVYEYRFWFFILEDSLKMSDEIANILAENFNGWSAKYGTGNNAPFEQQTRRGKGKGGPEPSGGGGTQLRHEITDDEMWALIKTETDWINAVHTYTGDRRFLKESVLNQCLSARIPIRNMENPINPYNVMAAHNYFRGIAGTTDRDPTQADVRNYKTGDTWSFPLPHCVLRVMPHWFSVSYIRHMYTPDTQKRLVEPRLDRGLRNRQNSVATDDNSDSDSDEDEDDLGGLAGAVANEEIDSGSGCSINLDFAANERTALRNADVANSEGGADLEAELARAIAGENDDGADEWDREVDVARAASSTRALQPHTGLGAGVRKVKKLHTSLVPSSFLAAGDYSMRGYLDGNFESSESASNKTHLHTLRADYHEMTRSHIERIEEPNKRGKEIMLMQFRATAEYISKCTQSCSNIAPVGREINRWMEKHDFNRDDPNAALFPLAFTDCERPFIDPSLSLFATMVVNEFNQLENCHYMYTAHAEAFLIRIAALTAYWYAFNTLRLNVILYGPAQTSKSYPITVVKDTMIDNTVQSLTNESALADAHDGDDTDMPKFYEEMPNEMIMKSNKPNEKQDALKEVLTRNVYTRRVLVLYDNGKRLPKLTRSEKHTAYIGASNLPRNQINEPIATRHVMRNQVARSRPGCDISERKSAMDNASRQDRLATQNSVHNMRLRQALHYHVEKMIMTGCLLEPSLVVLSLIYPRYKKLLKDRYALHVNRRVDDQVRAFVRVVVIQRAIHWLYHSPDSPFYNAERVSMWHFVLLNPLLKDDEELVYFALDQFRASFIDPNQEVVIKTIREGLARGMMARATDIDKHFESAKERTARRQNARQQLLSNAVGGAIKIKKGLRATLVGKSAAPVKRSANFDDIDVQEPARRDSDPSGDPGKSGQDATTNSDNTRDYDYMVFDMSLQKLAIVICSEMRRTDAARKLEVAAVANIMKRLTQRKLWSHPFVKTFDVNGKPTLALDTSAKLSYYNAIRLSEDESVVYVHSSLVFGHEDDAHEAAIKSCMTAYTPRTKYLSGLAINDMYPHLLRTRNVGPTTFIPRVEHIARIEPPGSCKTNASAFINMSYDEYATRKRLRQLSIPLTRKAVEQCNFRLSDQRSLLYENALVDNPSNYPEDERNACDRVIQRNKSLMLDVGNDGHEHLMLKYHEYRGDLEREFQIQDAGFADDPEPEFVPIARPVRNRMSVVPSEGAADNTNLFGFAATGRTVRARDTPNDFDQPSPKRRRLQTPNSNEWRAEVDIGHSNGPGISGAALLASGELDSFEETSFFGRVVGPSHSVFSKPVPGMADDDTE